MNPSASPIHKAQVSFLSLAVSSAVGLAGSISPISATTDNLVFGDPAFLIDGVIDVDQNAGIGGSVSGQFAGPYSVTFDLGGVFNLTGIQLWNNAGNIDNDGEGIDAFFLRFEDAAGQLAGTLSANAADSLDMQVFEFDFPQVTFVDLRIESNHAPTMRNYAALHEIAFVPAPTVAVLIMPALLLRGARRRVDR